LVNNCNVAPDKIETVYGTHEVVAQVFVYGDSLQSTLVGVAVPDEEQLKLFAAELGITGKSFAELCASNEVKVALQKSLDKHGRSHGLQGFENVKALYLETDPFTPENGLLSPTFKFKRHEGKLKYQKEIDAMYASLQ
jgi:long-chain acyl-CoA synthetase